VGVCSTVRVGGTVSYILQGTFGINAAFEGGQMRIVSVDALGNPIPGVNELVTPDGGVPEIGPLPGTPGVDLSTCTTQPVTDSLNSKTVDLSIGSLLGLMDANRIIRLQFRYGPEGTIAHTDPNLVNLSSATTPIQIKVAAAPTCSIAPTPQTICEGGSATFTVTPTVDMGGPLPVTYCWRKCGTAGACLSSAATLTINPATLADAGCYEATVTDTFGCPTTCQATLNVTPTPSCTITGDNPVCEGTTHTYTSTVLPAGGTVTHSWSISGNGTINGSTTDATVSVTAGAGGSFTLTDNITRDNCPSQCTYTVTVNPNPTCSITGPTPAACSSTGNVYTSSVLPTGGTVTHSWSISGDGTIVGATDGPSVTVTAGATGSFTLVDVISRDGCPGRCEITVPITPCPPSIIVIKEVICVPPGCDAFPVAVTDLTAADRDIVSTHAVTGVKVVQHGNPDTTICPKFCYRLTIINTGAQDVVIDSISDVATPANAAFDLSNCTGNLPAVGGTLAQGQRYSCIINNVSLCDTTANTFTVNGHGAQTTSATVSESDTDTVTIKEVDIECEKLVSTAAEFGSNTSPSDLTLIDTGAPLLVQYRVRITKSGDADVTFSSVTITDTGVTGCTPPALSETDLGVLNSGGTVELPLCEVEVNCADLPFTNTVTVSGVPSPNVGETTACLPVDSQGVPVNATSTCQATIRCEQPKTCRVTGGGVLIPNQEYVQDCNPATANAHTMVQGPACNGLQAVKITHGGQLGAPFSQQDCGQILGSPCIRGQWEHVRHYQGKANPQTVIAVDNFHSNTPKGIFDSLKCACLPCCENPDATGLVNGLCNPDDHKICGPEPRPAPANAIIFSGVGYIKTCDTANQKGKAAEQPVIFLVYIEDRSEPGGSHPGGANRPDDIYCFQAWALNGTDINSAQNQAARRAVAGYACDFIGGRASGALAQGTLPSFGTPIVNDCGALSTGNHQIHPSTSATCNQ